MSKPATERTERLRSWRLIAALVGSFLVAGGVEAKTLKFGYILSPTSQLGEGERVFAEEVAARTGGRYTIENYPSAMLGGEIAMMKAVELGALDLAFITGAALANVLPEAGIFNIPFLFHDAAKARLVLDGPIGDDYLAAFAKIDVVGLAWGENGMRHITNSKRPIRTVEDLKGLKLRLPQSEVMREGFAALGVEVRKTSFPEVYSALQSGSVDGEENPIATIRAAHFYEVQNHLSLTAHVYDPALIMMSSTAYASMSDADKAAFRQAAKIAANASRRVASDAERGGIAFLKSSGMAVVEDIDTGAFAARMSVAEPLFEKRFGHEAIERIRSYAETPAPSGHPSP